MPTFRRSAALVLGVTLATLAACSDAPSAPRAPLAPGDAPQHVVLTSPTPVRALLRNTPLAGGVRASAVIGSAGGTLTLWGTGLTLRVPAGAVSVPTTFTVSAPAGRGVWYDFGPSGAKFAVPLVITQDLRGTNAGSVAPSALQGGYFVDGSRSEATGTAKVTEVLPVTFNSTYTALSFNVTHFSGYMVSTGRSDF